MASKNDYYQTLGVPKGASQEEIKQAYRKLAREHHPDMAKEGDKAAAEQKFKEINEAYQILSDPQKRKMYDQFGHAGTQQGAGGPGGFGGFGGQQGGQWGPFNYSYTAGGQGFEDFDPFDVFEDFFGFRGFGGQRAPKKGKNLYYEMEIDFADAIHGVEKKVQVESGPLTVKVPSGLSDGMEMRFSGRGMPGPQGTPNGDLFITFRVSVPRQFQRVGNHLVVSAEIDFVQATLGDVIEVLVVEPSEKTALGKAKLKIPAGTQPGTQFRLKGKGLPLLNRGRGDVIVQVFVKIPQKLNKRQKDLLEEYKKSL